MASLFRILQRADWVLLFASFVLFAFGISAIYSVELSRGTEGFILIKKQLIALLLGLGLAFALARTNYQLFRSYARALYAVGIAMLVGVLLFGAELNGAKGWFVLPHVAAFQPIEFMKFALIVELARYYSEHARRRFGWRDLVRSGGIAALPVVLAMLQPDLGGAILLGAIWCSGVFFAGARIEHVGVLVLGATAAVLIGWFLVFHDYQKERVLTFLDPSRDALGRGYNVTQAKIAIGSGGLFGRGLGSGSQSQLRFLPESQADFVFAVIAEELGFVGVATVVLAIGAMLLRIVSLARKTRDTFAAHCLLGIFALFFFQSIVHIGANLALLPATGVALPFVSYGGSALLLSFTLLGAAQSVAMTLTPGGKGE